MTDLEMTKLCAKAMGFKYGDKQPSPLCYDPLNDDANAMALVKELRLFISPRTNGDWCVFLDDKTLAFSTDLNRAIVECVAKMQAGKEES